MIMVYQSNDGLFNALGAESKHCPKCRQFLPHNYFVRNKSRKDGLDHYCKKCRLERVNFQRKKKQGKLELVDPGFDFGTKWQHSFPMVGFYKTEHDYIKSDKIVYVLVSCATKEVLMVGQTTNWRERFSRYSAKNKDLRPLWVYMFEANSWLEQDRLYKDLVTNLRKQNINLPWNKKNA